MDSQLNYTSLYSFTFQGGKTESRKIPVPPHRYTPLKDNWMKIFTPIVEHLKLQIRFNLSARKVEIRVRTFDYKYVRFSEERINRT